MKVAITFLALVALGFSSPSPTLFHKLYVDFFNVIWEESGDQIVELAQQYYQCEDHISADFMESSKFTDLYNKLIDLPEFQAVTHYLEEHDIDIFYLINSIQIARTKDFMRRRSTHTHICDTASGHDFNTLLQEVIAVFPKHKLVALYKEKMNQDISFKNAIESFKSAEWNEIYKALWINDWFLDLVAALKEEGFDLKELLAQIKDLLGCPIVY